MDFKPGQRWICDADLTMGLGTVMSTDQRTVTIAYNATGESRAYAKQDAPLTRVKFSIGDTIPDARGGELRIESIQEQDGLLTYTGSDTSGNVHSICESELANYIRLDRPADRLFTGNFDADKWFRIRCQSQLHRARLADSDMHGLIGTRTSLLPHQLYIAHEVAHRYAPRVMLADEVGLGKTIEAGLILHHQLLTERAGRVLVVVPETLVHQWLVEMLRRFNLYFSIFNEERCQALVESDPQDNPFHTEQLVLCSLEFLTAQTIWYQQACAGDWDLLVVDEAHHLQWSSLGASREYEVIETLAGVTRGVLLLTATPEQLGKESHFARLRLLDRDRFADFDEFIQEEASYRQVADAVDALLDNRGLDAQAGEVITNALQEQDTRDLLDILQHSATDSSAYRTARQELVDSLVDRHGTGRVLFRNTRAAVKGFPPRQVIAYPLPLPAQYTACISNFVNNGDSAPRLLLCPELLYQADAADSTDWTRIDPRLDWLARILKQYRPGKILVITASPETTLDLAQALRTRYGIHPAVFHEQMSLVERDRAAAYFAEMEEGSQVLICSEIGSEGRNFQFAHHLVLFDLPFNPDLLEQRIGRLDRIGQTGLIHIHLPYLQGSPQEYMYRWYHEGLDAFSQTCPAGYAVFVRLESELEQALKQAAADTDVTDALIEKTCALRIRLNEELKRGRDRLLEYNSCRPALAASLKQRAVESDADDSLQIYLEGVFDCYGVNSEEHSEGSYILQPGERLLSPFPGLYDEGMTVTYSRDIALVFEDRHFLSWEHPMVINAMDMILGSESGNAAVTAVKYRGIKPGTLLLEILYVLESGSVRGFSPHQYLPPITITAIIDTQGRVYTGLSHDQVNMHTVPLAVNIARQIVDLKQDDLRQMLKAGEQAAQGRVGQLITAARQRSRQSFTREIERLQALRRINPNVRMEEIQYFVQCLQQLEDAVDAASLRLDALRVIVAT
jgi:ATP-dependent helicase HepA